MANMEVKDGAGAQKYLKASGAGSSGDPFIIEQNVNVSSALPAGTNNIGDVDVLSLPALPAGTNNIGDVDIASALPAGDNNIGNVDIVSLPSLPAGTNNIGDVDVLSLPALPAGNNNIGDVDIASAIPAGTNYIGKTRLTDGTNDVTLKNLTNAKAVPSAIVDGNGDQITSFGGGTQYTEGDTDASITGTAMLWEDTSDTLRAVSAAKPMPVNIISGAGSGGTAIQDDTAFTPGTTNLTPVGGTYRSSRDTVDDNDAGAFAMTQSRALLACLETPNGDSAMDDTNDAVKTVLSTAIPAGNNNIGDVDIASALPAGDNNIGNVDVVTLPNVTLAAGTNTNEVVGDVAHDAAIAGNPLLIGGVASAAAPTNVSADQDAVRAWFLRNGALAVNLTAAGALIPGDATNGLDTDVTRLPSALSGVSGDVAHDGADSGNPVKIGAKAVNAEPSAVANNDRANLISDLVGKLITLPYANPENFIAGTTSDITGTSNTSVIAAQGSGVRIYVTQIIVTNSHASVNTWVNIKDGTTTIYSGYAYSAGGGFVINFPVPLRLTANTALNAACETTGANVRVSASGYKGV